MNEDVCTRLTKAIANLLIGLRHDDGEYPLEDFAACLLNALHLVGTRCGLDETQTAELMNPTREFIVKLVREKMREKP